MKKIPANIEEFLEGGWDRLVKKHILRFNLKDITYNVEDLTQDILLKMVETNYLESFDKEQRDFNVYIVVFVRNYLCRLYKRECLSKNGWSIVNAKGIEFSSPDNPDTFDKNMVYLDTLEAKLDEDPDLNLLIEDLRAELQSKFKASSFIEFNGQTIGKEPVQVLNLLLQDYTVSEISSIFDTSKQFVYILLNKIRSSENLSFYTPRKSRR